MPTQLDLKSLIPIVLVGLLLVGKCDGPSPDPAPDPPVPDVDDAPFPADELTVVIVEETETRMRGELSPGHFAALTSIRVRKWAKESGVHFRVFDQHTPTEGMTATEKAAFSLKFQSLPWIHISNGESGFTGPLPDGVDGTIALMERYK